MIDAQTASEILKTLKSIEGDTSRIWWLLAVWWNVWLLSKLWHDWWK